MSVTAIADDWWARDFACSGAELRPVRTRVQRHAGGLLHNPGMWILVAGGAPLVSLPSDSSDALAEVAQSWSTSDVADIARLHQQLAPLCPRPVEKVVLDVTDSNSVERGVRDVLAQGPLDVLVNNAGNCWQQEFLWCSEADLEQEMNLNYFGAQRMIRALLPAFVQQRAGRIINVSSLLGSSAAPTTANYSASKAALEAFSRALRGELARFGIRVIVFVAPHTQTELGTRTEFRGVTSLPVEYVARELVHAIDTSPHRYAASPVYRLLLRLAAWFPALMERKMVECVQHLFREPALLNPDGGATVVQADPAYSRGS